MMKITLVQMGASINLLKTIQDIIYIHFDTHNKRSDHLVLEYYTKMLEGKKGIDNRTGM